MNIIRYKRDLRVLDHVPLTTSMASGQTIAVYFFEPDVMSYDDYSIFHHTCIVNALLDLKKSLTGLNVPLLIFHDNPVSIFSFFKKTYNISHIYAHEETGNGVTHKRDLDVITRCKQHTIAFHETPTGGIVRKLKERDQRGSIRYERIRQSNITPIPSPQNPLMLSSCLIKNILLPEKSALLDIFNNYKETKFPLSDDLKIIKTTETDAHNVLHSFLSKRSNKYMFSVSRPNDAQSYCSRLSTYIAYGCISLRTVYLTSGEYMSSLSKSSQTGDSSFSQKKQLTAFLSRLHRHDHFIQKLESDPSSEYKNLNPAFDAIRNRYDENIMKALVEGRTGIPIIDACLAALRQTGWVTFRMRAMLVSFFCNTCLQPRQRIAHIFAQYFVDYEPGIHYSQFQMQSGTAGINIIRLYNPLKQHGDKDPKSTFVKHYLPELKNIPHEFLINPYILTKAMKETYNANTYPEPIIDIESANRSARALLWETKQSTEAQLHAKTIYHKLGSRKKQTNFRKKKKTKKPDSGERQVGLFG